MAEVFRLPLATPLRRRVQIRFKHARATERRKKKTAGFDVAQALEHNLDAYPLQQDQMLLLQRWLLAAEREELAERHTEYVYSLQRAVKFMQGARRPEEAILALHAARER